MLNEAYGRHALKTSQAPFTCGLTGQTYSAPELKQRVAQLASSLAQEMGWEVEGSSEWEKVAAVFALNTIDTMTVIWAVHTLSGIVTLANAAYSVSELTHQLKSSKARVLFTCVPLLGVALAAAKQAGIPEKHVYILSVPHESSKSVGNSVSKRFKTLNQLIANGVELPVIERVPWATGRGARQVALLSYSSGTSGPPKAVMISHYNVICNILQIEAQNRLQRKEGVKQNVLGMMPQSHIYGLIVVCHASIYVGDGVITLPNYNFNWMLDVTQNFRITTLYLVPPVIIRLAKNHNKLKKHDLSSVEYIWTGAAPLAKEIALTLQAQHPSWKVLQGYGLTETCTLVSSSPPHDQWLGSSGSLLPGMKARLVAADGTEITAHDTPGELYIHSPSNALGYLNNDAATLESFPNGWMRTGDEALFSKSPQGHEHVFIVDRIKELIKVKGHQVAPAELEAILLSHPLVADVAVIPISDEDAGEIPKAFVVRTDTSTPISDKQLQADLYQHIASQSARYKWLDGGVEFIDEIPKSPAGKILRRLLRGLEAEKATQKTTAKL